MHIFELTNQIHDVHMFYIYIYWIVFSTPIKKTKKKTIPNIGCIIWFLLSFLMVIVSIYWLLVPCNKKELAIKYSRERMIKHGLRLPAKILRYQIQEQFQIQSKEVPQMSKSPCQNQPVMVSNWSISQKTSLFWRVRRPTRTHHLVDVV